MTTQTNRTQLKDLVAREKEMSGKDMKQVQAGGAKEIEGVDVIIKKKCPGCGLPFGHSGPHAGQK